MTTARHYPLPFASDVDNPLGLPLSVKELDAPRQQAAMLPFDDLPQISAKKGFTHTVYRMDGVKVATLGYGVDVDIANRLVAAINPMANLRLDWDFESIEQIPLIIYHAERLLTACEVFFSGKDKAIAFAKRHLMLSDKYGWRGLTKIFLAAVSKSSDIKIDEMLKGTFRHEYFSKFGHQVNRASRIVCVLSGTNEKKTGFIIVGYDPICPQAQRLYAEILASTLLQFLNLNPHNPLLPVHFVRMTQALQAAVPEILSSIGTTEVIGTSGMRALQGLNGIKYCAEKLLKSFKIFTESTTAPLLDTLRTYQSVEDAYEFHHQRLAAIRDYIAADYATGRPMLSAPLIGVRADQLRVG